MQKFVLNTIRQNIPDDELLDDLRMVASSFGRSVTQKKYGDNGKFSFATLKNRFGTWNQVLQKVGLESTSTSPNVTEEELFQNLEEVWIKLGRQPKSSEMARPLSKYSREIYRQRYGTWNKALEAFVEAINNASPVDEAEESKVIKEQEEQLDTIYKHKTKRETSWRMRFQVLSRDNFRCVSCGLSPAIAAGTILHVDHKKAWSKGGETVMENLQTLCVTCNLGKGDID